MKYVTFATIFIGILLSGCGSGDSTDSNAPVVIDEGATSIAVEVCSDLSSVAFTEIETGDVLSVEDANTTVKFKHDVDSSKYVCVLSGKAFLWR